MKTVILPEPLARWRRTPEEIEEIKKQLRAGGSPEFHPAGFGTGYRISTRHSRWSHPAPKLSQFFGVQVYTETMDCD